MEEQYAVARLRRGDLSGLEYLVQAHQVRAIRAAYLIVRDRALAEDIVQNAFIRVCDRITQFDVNRPFGPWFLKGVVNDSLKAIIRQKRQVPLEWDFEDGELTRVSYLVDSAPGLPEIVERAETERAIWDALGKLTPAQRTAIVLRYYLDFSEAEMIEKLNRPRGTIKWLLHAARERLRDLLGQPWSKAHPARSPKPDND